MVFQLEPIFLTFFLALTVLVISCAFFLSREETAIASLILSHQNHLFVVGNIFSGLRSFGGKTGPEFFFVFSLCGTRRFVRQTFPLATFNYFHFI